MSKNTIKNKTLISDIICAIITAILFSAFIYLEHFGITVKFINTILGILALGAFLYIPKRAVVFAGFFIGIFWFYWIGYSFKYNGVGYLTPIITFSFGLIYAAFFGILAFTKETYIRAILLFALSFFEPMDWNWMQIELLFVDSYIGVYKYQLAIMLFALALPKYINNKYKFTPLLLILLAFNISYPEQKDAPLKIKLVQTDIKQEDKWKKSQQNPTILMVYKEIIKAKNEGYEMVVFPESVFPIYMNKSSKLIDMLEDISHDITIVAGSLMYEDKNNYNVTYIFNDGEYILAKKMVLVPFGEYVPLPSFAKKFINDTFFAGASDFKTASKPTDFKIKGTTFRNAICYEATCKELYEGDVDFIVASSNNAWFAPSIEPTIQKLLMRYYARKNGVTIYHSANYKGTGVIK
jgi:apolipoprotein N-acyltransferase